MFDDPDLHRAVESDAAEVRGREETDSIAIIDDIRSHIRLVLFSHISSLSTGLQSLKSQCQSSQIIWYTVTLSLVEKAPLKFESPQWWNVLHIVAPISRSSVRTMSDMEDAERRLNIVEILVAALGLDA